MNSPPWSAPPGIGVLRRALNLSRNAALWGASVVRLRTFMGRGVDEDVFLTPELEPSCGCNFAGAAQRDGVRRGGEMLDKAPPT